MPEILTESFCERCGTRYTFESSSATRTKPLRGLKTFGRGLRNFVLSDDTSMDEAMAAARSEAERDVTSRQLDAFHSTFNFCMSCRQYTCANCWNEAEGTCLTCSPLAVRETATGPFPTVDVSAAQAAAAAVATNGTPEAPTIEAPSAWPMAELDVPIDEPVEATAPDEIDLGARLAAIAALDVATEGPREAEREPEPVAAEAEPVVAEPEPEPVAAEPESVVAEPEPEPPAPAPIAPEPEPEPVAAAQPPQDIVEQPVWLSVAPDPDATPGVEAPAAEPGLAAAASATPQWPTQPEWPSQPQWPSARTATPRPNTILGRPVLPTGGIDALWAASSRDVLAPPLASAPTPLGQQVPAAAQPCVNCGLSLSSTARFCRRCGTAQTHA
jgi:hypothetical protein